MNALAHIAVFYFAACALYVLTCAASAAFWSWQVRRAARKAEAQEREMRKMIRALIAEHREAELVLVPDYREPGED